LSIFCLPLAPLKGKKYNFFNEALLGKLWDCKKLNFLVFNAASVENPLEELENSLLRSTSLGSGHF
jgi:hypothetical protein